MTSLSVSESLAILKSTLMSVANQMKSLQLDTDSADDFLGLQQRNCEHSCRTAEAKQYLSRVREQIQGGLRRRDDVELRKVFNSHAEVDGKIKHISSKSILHALKAVHVDINDDEAESFVQLANSNEDAFLDFDEFKQAVQSSTRMLPRHQWAQSLPIAELLADALPKSSGSGPLREIGRLTNEEIELIAEAFSEALKSVLKEHIGKLKAAHAALDSASIVSTKASKFDVEKMSCGKIGDFHSGLHKRIGSCHLEFEKAMCAEHCSKEGCEIRFTTTNYEILTWPKKEWAIVHKNFDLKREEKRGDRQIPDIDGLVESNLAKQTDLKRAEVIAIILYTGPMFQVYNTILRRHPEPEYERFKAAGNLFSTTIFVLVSAVQKISRTMKLPRGLRLYRGLGGTKDLPDSFFHCDANGCKGYVDWGFMSATADKTIAIRYSGVEDKRRPFPIVLEISFGAVDRGACIRDFSQYPSEVEYLYVPCSFLEQDGPERVESSEQGVVRIFPVKVNANLKTLTIEEHLRQKKTTHIMAFSYAIDEIDKDLRALAKDKDAEARLQADPTRDPSHSVEGFLSRIVQQCREVLARHEATPDERYTIDDKYRSLVLEMVNVKRMAISKLEEWLENKDCSFIRYRIGAPLRTAHRRWICYLHKLHSSDQATSDDFFRLCKVKGLVVNNVGELNELGETRLMSFAAEGRSRRDLKLLVQAKAGVDYARPDGVTPMWLAAQFGHVYVINELADLKADVNKCANDMASPLYIASQSGNLDCIKALIKLDANVNSLDKNGLSPLHQAAINGHELCIKALINSRGDINQMDNAGKTAADHVAEHDAKCMELLVLNALIPEGDFSSLRKLKTAGSCTPASQHDAEINRADGRRYSESHLCVPSNNDNNDKRSELPPKALIMSTGDLSDVDGFMALAQYAKTGADVLYIMNYPAYLGVLAGDADPLFAESHPGQGYKYGANEVLENVEKPPEGYSKILSSYGEDDASIKIKRAMTDVAFWVANKVWNEVEPDGPEPRGSLLFCIGGINQINPFSARAIKNEILSYSKFNPDIKKLSPTQGEVYDATGQHCEVNLEEYTDIYIDFNGSMACWNEHWNSKLSDVKDKVKGAFVMGGVWAETAPVTKPSIPEVLNRFSSATMNQLYHPQHTADFFAFLAQSKIPTFTVTNNAVSELTTHEEGGMENIDTGIVQFLSTNAIGGQFLREIALDHYSTQPRKPFDFYSALALTTLKASQNPQMGKSKTLFYSNVYGITFVSPFDSWEVAREAYSKAVHASLSSKGTDLQTNFRHEIAMMKGIQYLECLPVRDLSFKMDAKEGFKLEILPWDQAQDS